MQSVSDNPGPATEGTPLWILVRRLGWLMLFGVGWIGLFTVQNGLAGPANWSGALETSIQFWLPWVVLSPFVLELAFRFPLEKPRLWAHAAIHVTACVLIAVGSYQLQRSGLPTPGGGRPWNRPGPPGDGEIYGRPFRTAGPPPFSAARRAGFRTAFDILLYALLVTGCHATTFFRRSEQRQRRTLELEASLASARLQVLRSQLNPHFLFNALNAISTLVHTQPRAADEMIATLSQLLRLSLETFDEPEIPLRRELELVDCYLEIEQVRFGDRLTVHRDVDPRTWDAWVPTLLLQPLVENAVRHGIEPRRGPGRVTLHARRLGDRLLLRVEDDGVGLDVPPTSAVGLGVSREHRGIGLGNTRTRLQELYGRDHRFELGPGSNGGCRVEIEIPWRPTASRLRPELNG